jgi:hypothetical protein
MMSPIIPPFPVSQKQRTGTHIEYRKMGWNRMCILCPIDRGSTAQHCCMVLTWAIAAALDNGQRYGTGKGTALRAEESPALIWSPAVIIWPSLNHGLVIDSSALYHWWTSVAARVGNLAYGRVWASWQQLLTLEAGSLNIHGTVLKALEAGRSAPSKESPKRGKLSFGELLQKITCAATTKYCTWTNHFLHAFPL